MQPNNQYDFITNPEQPQKPSGLAALGTMNKKMLALIGGGALVLLLLIITIIASMMSGGPTNKDHLVAAAAQQAEIIRVSDIALKEAQNSDARSLAITTKLSLQSDQAELSAALKAQKVKMPKAAKNSKADALLTEATQNNRFDQAYMEFIQEQLVEYQKKLYTAHQTSESNKLKETLKNQYLNASILIGVDPEL